jgi:hypothetical protein
MDYKEFLTANHNVPYRFVLRSRRKNNSILSPAFDCFSNNHGKTGILRSREITHELNWYKVLSYILRVKIKHNFEVNFNKEIIIPRLKSKREYTLEKSRTDIPNIHSRETEVIIFMPNIHLVQRKWS